MNTQVGFWLTIEPKIGCYETIKQAVLNIVPLTRKEPGCEAYVLHESLDSDILFLYELFKSQEAFDHHLAQDYTKVIKELFEKELKHPLQFVSFKPNSSYYN